MEHRKKYQETIKKIMNGQWKSILEAELVSSLGLERSLVGGSGNKSLNLFTYVVDRLAILYDAKPTTNSAWDSYDLFRYHKDIHRNVVAFRELPVLVSYDAGLNKFIPQALDPDDVEVELDGDGNVVWMTTSRCIGGEHGMLEMDVRGGVGHMIFYPNGKTTCIELPWEHVDENGRPYIPVVFYKMERSQVTWTPEKWDSLIDATLSTAISYTHYLHSLYDASWAQKVGIDLDAAGSSIQANTGVNVATLPADPSAVLMLRSTGSGTGSIDTWEPAVDPEVLIRTLTHQVRLVTGVLGLGTIGIEHDGAQESGIALTIKATQEARIRNGMIESARDCDLKYVNICRQLGVAYGLQVPALPSTIQYILPATSIEEKLRKVEYEQKRIDLLIRAREAGLAVDI